MQTPTEKRSFGSLARNPSNLRTHPDVPENLAVQLVEQLLTGESMNVDRYVNAHFEKLRGHSLDASQLMFKNVSRLRSTLVVANADPGASWNSFGALVIVTKPKPSAAAAGVFMHVDFYSVAPRSSNAIYVGDVYLRLDLAKDGSVLKDVLGAVEDADKSSILNVYGSKLYVAALALASAEIEALA